MLFLADPTCEHSRQDQAACAKRFLVQTPQAKLTLTNTSTLLPPLWRDSNHGLLTLSLTLAKLP